MDTTGFGPVRSKIPPASRQRAADLPTPHEECCRAMKTLNREARTPRDAPTDVYRFAGPSAAPGAGFRLEAARRRVWRGNDLVAMPAKAFDLLVLLVAERQRVVEKDELMRRLWPDTFV